MKGLIESEKTIYDIAEELNLAPSTISKAINNTEMLVLKLEKEFRLY